MLELAVLPVTRVLRLLAHDPASADDVASAGATGMRKARTNKFYGIALADIVNADLLTRPEPTWSP